MSYRLPEFLTSTSLQHSNPTPSMLLVMQIGRIVPSGTSERMANSSWRLPSSQVNTTTADNQKRARTAMADDGSYAIVWESKNQDGDKEGVYVRLFDPAGNATTGEILVNETTATAQKEPSIAMDDSGNFVVSWQSQHEGGDKKDVYARLFNSAGVAQTGEFLVNQTTGGDQKASAVAMDADGTSATTQPTIELVTSLIRA